GHHSRKALLLITDGDDNRSRYTFSEIRRFAMEQDVLIYSVGILTEWSPPGERSGRSVLEDLAELTGGDAFFPASIGGLEGICAQISLALRNQYVLGYRSLNYSKDGKWRKIRVKINTPKGAPRLAVRTKTGYFAPGG